MEEIPMEKEELKMAASSLEDLASEIVLEGAKCMQQKMVQLLSSINQSTMARENQLLLAKQEWVEKASSLEEAHKLQLQEFVQKLLVLQETYKSELKVVAEENQRKNELLKTISMDMAEVQTLKIHIQVLEARGFKLGPDFEALLVKARTEFEDRIANLVARIELLESRKTEIEQVGFKRRSNAHLVLTDDEDNEKAPLPDQTTPPSKAFLRSKKKR